MTIPITLALLAFWAIPAAAYLMAWRRPARPVLVHLHDGDGLAACDGSAGRTLTDDPGTVSCRDCGPRVAVLRAAAGDASLDPSWWGAGDTGRDIPQVSGRDMSHDTASPYPVAVECREGLSGHTITVEVLDEDAARRWASPPDDIDRLAVIERTDGWFGTVRHVVQGGAADPDELAEVSALSLGARYVPVEVAR